MSNYLATAPLDLFNANHDKPRHTPGTRCRYGPKAGGPVDEYMYVQATTALAARRACFSTDILNGTVQQTNATGEKKVAGYTLGNVITILYFTWIKLKGKSSVLGFVLAAGDVTAVDGNGFTTVIAADNSQATGVALAVNAAANAGAAVASKIMINIE